MSPRDEEVRTALEMFPIHIIRRILDERDISFKSRKSAELIDKLMQEVHWDDQQFQDLKNRLARIQREQKPFSRYISEIEAVDPGLESKPSHKRIEQLLSNYASEFEGDELLEPGFEIREVGTDSVKGIHWTKSINYSITPLNNIKTEETLYNTGFEINLTDDVMFINCNLPAKARSLLKKLDANGIRTSDVGHENLANRAANQYVQDFVYAVRDRLEDHNTQETFPGEAERALIEVDLVEMLVDDAKLEDIRIGGKTDIIENPAVREFRDEHDARIVRLEGELRLDTNWYKFTTGYTEGMGTVSVTKKGSVEEQPELVENAFEFLYDSYGEYFVDV